MFKFVLSASLDNQFLEHKFSACEPDVGPRTYRISLISHRYDLAGVGESDQSHTMLEPRKEG